MTDFNELFCDNILNISTVGRDDTHVSDGVFAYEPTSYLVLDRMHEKGMFSDINLLVDYGCGKGRVPFYIAYYCERAAIGVESEDDFYKVAEKNRENFKLSGLVEFVHMKAEDYVVPDRADVFFFFHPFSETVLEKVLGNIEESHQRCRRRIRLIMYYMTAEYIKLMKNHPEYELISKTDCRDLFKNRDGRDFVFWYEKIS